MGTNWVNGVPIEVVPMAYKSVLKSIENNLSVKPIKAALRMAINKAGPVVTDNGNFVIDAHFGPLTDPYLVLNQLKMLTGMYEIGLFLGMAEKAFFGEKDGSVEVWERK